MAVLPPGVKLALMAKIGLYLLGIIVSLCCMILILECVFASAGVGEQEYLRLDKTLGFAPMEGKHVTWRKEGFGRIQFNSHGMNDADRPSTKPAHTYRIAVVGDSFVEALQVDPSKNFCRLLEDQLNAKYGSHYHFEVLNFGCSAYNLGQFSKKINSQVFIYQPDLLIVGFSVDATKLLAPLQDGFVFANARPTFTLNKQGQLVEDWQIFNWWRHSPDGKRIARTAFLRRYSRIWAVIGTMVGAYSSWCEDLKAGKGWTWGLASAASATPTALAAAPADFVSSPAFAPAPSAALAQAASKTRAIALPQAQGDVDAATKLYWPVADKLIREIDSDCRRQHCRLVVVHFPARPDIGYDNPPETKNLEDLTAALKIPYADLTAAFVNAPKQANLIYSVHLTPAGHKLVCSEIAHFLEKDSLLFNY